MKGNLYALLVGINKYRHPVRQLSGCLNDVLAIKNYLKLEEVSRNFNETSIQCLTEKGATKQNIVNFIEQQLGKANKNDTALFYFSGHGTQEKADTRLWKNEPENNLECLVCYDSIPENGNIYNFLADKELRWLIQNLSKKNPHIITIFDCCSSGDNTRNFKIQKDVKNINFKYTSGNPFPKRAWTDFIFSQEINYDEALNSTSINEIIPLGKHLSLSACRNDQSAVEINQEGIFTKSLIDVLTRYNHSISYYDLKQKLTLDTRHRYAQTPQILYSHSQEQLSEGFLGLDRKPLKLRANLNFLAQKNQWLIDLGFIHGLNTQIGIFEVTDLNEKEKIKAQIKSIDSNSSIITFLGNNPSQENTWIAHIPNLLSYPISLHINEQSLERLLNFNEYTQNHNFLTTKKEYTADYSVTTNEEEITIHLPYQQDKPLAAPIPISDSDYDKIFISFINKIQKWEFVKNLRNQKTFGKAVLPFEVEIFEINDEGKELPVNKFFDNVSLELRPKNGTAKAAIKIKVTNTYSKTLFIGAIFLANDFEIVPEIFQPSIVCLNPNESVWAYEGEIMELRLMEYLRQYNWDKDTSFIKIIASTEDDLSIDSYGQSSLPHPIKNRDFIHLEIDRGPLLPYRPEKKWWTNLVEFHLINPFYKE